MNLDNKYSVSLYLRNGISVCKDTKYPEHWKMMRGELRGEIFARLRVRGRTLMQVGRETVTGEGKIWAAFPAWGSVAGRSLHIPSHTGGEKIKIHGRALCPVVACGDYFFVEEGFQIQIVEKGRTHTYFVIPDCRGIRNQGRETPDKRIYRTRQKILFQM